MAADDRTSRLLALPDPCLVTVMQCCASDTCSLLSAATAHSRLQRAAVEALGSISATVWNQQHLDSLLLYLAQHGQHLRSLALRAPTYDMQRLELPPSLTKLDSLQLEGIDQQLQPGLAGTQGVLRAGLALTRLELRQCRLLDKERGLAAALTQLPDLQHLTVGIHEQLLFVPTDVFSHLVQLTSLLLQVVCCDRNRSSDPPAALQPLQALTGLVGLQLCSPHLDHCHVKADMLSGFDQLTRLVLSGKLFEPRALAGKAQLQHLTLERCKVVPGTGLAQLLSELQHLTQLTHMGLSSSCQRCADAGGPSPPPAAYVSLTASSRLQHLDFTFNILPRGAWQHMCPPGMTLRYLDIGYVIKADGSWALPDTSTLVSRCPGLQSLTTNMPCSTAQLAPLQQLTGLQSLFLRACRHCVS